MNVSLRQGESPTAHTVRINGLELLFSYETIVAFAKGLDGWTVSENIWSRTTGKHINQETGVLPKDRVPHDEFVRLLDAALSGL